MICMLAAVVFMPVAFLIKNTDVSTAIGLIIASMILEAIGLIFVITSLIKKRKLNKTSHD
jgi:uncharacterized phage infection (PIP) family protein YhgE